MGVGERIIIHTPKIGVCVSKNGCTMLPSYQLPDGFIQGTTGAGDAFCSGALIAIEQGKSDLEILEYAQTAAVASLRNTDATSGLQELSDLIKIFEKYERIQI